LDTQRATLVRQADNRPFGVGQIAWETPLVNQAPNKESQPIHTTQQVLGSALRDSSVLLFYHECGQVKSCRASANKYPVPIETASTEREPNIREIIDRSFE
jgi:hypothetical protein